MEGTCDFDNCNRKGLLDNKEQCENYIESWWSEENTDKPVLICDCAPKRTFMMIQDLHNRLIGVQQSQEQQRNESDKMKNNMIMVMEAMADMTNTKENKIRLEFMNDNMKLIEEN